MSIRNAVTAVAVVALSGLATADVEFVTGHGQKLYVTNAATLNTDVLNLADGEGAWTFSGMTTDSRGRVIAHTINQEVTEFYRVGSPKNDAPNMVRIGQSTTSYNTITYVGDRLFGIERQGSLNVIVEIDTDSFEKIGEWHTLTQAVGGFVYNEATDEFVFGDSRTRNFYAVSASDANADVRLIGAAGLAYGGSGLEMHDGRLYGAFVRAGSNDIVVGEVSLENGSVSILTNLGGRETGAGTSFTVIPTPSGLALLGLGGLVVARRRR
jgi:MYXO-CTERM domain-containing protein